jgi:hypothetical protein
MTTMTIDPRQDAVTGLRTGTLKTRTITNSEVLRHNPSSRASLVCRWHRLPTRVAGLPDLSDRDDFACRHGRAGDSARQYG